MRINQQDPFYAVSKDGLFNLDQVALEDSITMESRFYQKKVVSAHNLFSNRGILINPDTSLLNAVVVQDYLTSGVSTQLFDHSMEVNMNELGILAGDTDGDILNIISRLPGITNLGGKPGEISFRGSLFDHNLIYFDGIPIYHSGHFFGTISPYNPSAVSSLKLYRGTMPSSYGGRVGGLIELKGPDYVPVKTEADFAANTIYGSLGLRIPIMKSKWGVSISLRSNYPTDYLAPKLEAYKDLNFQGSRIDATGRDNPSTLDIFEVGFQDANIKSVYHINSKQKLELSYMTIQNQLHYQQSNEIESSVEIQNSDLDNTGYNTRWSSEWSDKFDSEVSFTQSRLNIIESNQQETDTSFVQETDISNDLEDMRVEAKLGLKINQNLKFEGGYLFTDQKTTLRDARSMAPEPIRIAEANTHSFFLSAKYNLGAKLVANAGGRFEYYDRLETTFLDPRLTISYGVNEYFFAKASGGRTHQYIKQLFNNDFDDFRLENQFWILAGDREPIIDATQGMLGFLYDNGSVMVDVEAYKKTTNGLVRSPGAINSGTLRATGIDIYIKKRWNEFESWISYSYSDNTIDFQNEVIVFFNQPHIANLTTMYRFRKWNFAASMSILSGMPVLIPLNQTNTPGEGMMPGTGMGPGDGMGPGTAMMPGPGMPPQNPPVTIPYEDSFPVQHQLDLSVTYKFWEIEGNYLGTLGLSILNVYNQENIINVFQENFRPVAPYRYAIGFAPNLSVRISL